MIAPLRHPVQPDPHAGREPRARSCQPVQRPDGRQPRPEAGNRRHLHRGYRLVAELRAGPELHARLLRHQGEGLHLEHRRRHDPQRLHQRHEADFCALVHRDAIGSIRSQQGYVQDTTFNTGGLRTSGIDVSATYRTGLDAIGLANAGSVSLNFVGTWLDKLETTHAEGRRPDRLRRPLRFGLFATPAAPRTRTRNGVTRCA